MSLEHRVERLESQFDALDSAVRSLMHIVGETHQMMLENQRENRIRFDQQDRKIEEVDRKVEVLDEKVEVLAKDVSDIKTTQAAMIDATFAGFKRSDEQHAETLAQIKQLELLIRQNHSDN